MLAWIASIAGAAGCTSLEPAVAVSLAKTPLATAVNLSTYLPDLSGQRRQFRRRAVHGRSTEDQQYSKRWWTRGRAEGLLIDVPVAALGRYLGPNKESDDQPLFPWPKMQAGTGDAFFLEFDPPLIEWPMYLSPLHPRTQQSRVLSYGPRGKALWGGVATRTLAFQGFADVQVDGRRYVHCALVHSETTMSFGFWFRVVLTERVWLAEGLGVVRRRERFSGSLLVFIRFASEYVYELSDGIKRTDAVERANAVERTGGVEPPARLGVRHDRGNQVNQIRAWHRAAVLLDRVLPAPRLAGLIVETNVND